MKKGPHPRVRPGGRGGGVCFFAAGGRRKVFFLSLYLFSVQGGEPSPHQSPSGGHAPTAAIPAGKPLAKTSGAGRSIKRLPLRRSSAASAPVGSYSPNLPVRAVRFSAFFTSILSHPTRYTAFSFPIQKRPPFGDLFDRLRAASHPACGPFSVCVNCARRDGIREGRAPAQNSMHSTYSSMNTGSVLRSRVWAESASASVRAEKARFCRIIAAPDSAALPSTTARCSSSAG